MGHKYASTVVCALSARSAVGVQSASTVVERSITCKECRAVKAAGQAELLGDVDAAEQGVKRKRASPTKGPCAHGVKYRSVQGVQACPHGRVRYQCKECGGSQICEHGRLRSICKECGGASICEHGRVRSHARSAVGHQSASTVVSALQCKECIASRRGQRTADVSRGAPSQDTEKHARQGYRRRRTERSFGERGTGRSHGG